jgi:hypothetical protein
VVNLPEVTEENFGVGAAEAQFGLDEVEIGADEIQVEHRVPF